MRQLKDWTAAADLDQYLAALEVKIANMPESEERSAAMEWLDWARNYRGGLDPLNNRLAMREDPQPTAANLQPHLGPWSFYGPFERP